MTTANPRRTPRRGQIVRPPTGNGLCPDSRNGRSGVSPRSISHTIPKPIPAAPIPTQRCRPRGRHHIIHSNLDLTSAIAFVNRRRKKNIPALSHPPIRIRRKTGNRRTNSTPPRTSALNSDHLKKLEKRLGVIRAAIRKPNTMSPQRSTPHQGACQKSRISSWIPMPHPGNIPCTRIIPGPPSRPTKASIRAIDSLSSLALPKHTPLHATQTAILPLCLIRKPCT